MFFFSSLKFGLKTALKFKFVEALKLYYIYNIGENESDLALMQR